MIINCVKNTENSSPIVLPYDLSHELSDMNFISSREWYSIDSNVSGYKITLGKKYTVYGILFFKNEIRYLICNDDNVPGFFPSTLFEILENYILFDWGINSYQIEDEKILLIGYSDLIKDFEHLRDLIEYTPDAVRTFLEYKNSL